MERSRICWDAVDLVQTLQCKTEKTAKQRAEQMRRRRSEKSQTSGSAIIITWLTCILHRVRVMGKDTLIGSGPPRTGPFILFLLNNLSVSHPVQFLLSHNVLGSSPTTLMQCMWTSSWSFVLSLRLNLKIWKCTDRFKSILNSSVQVEIMLVHLNKHLLQVPQNTSVSQIREK